MLRLFTALTAICVAAPPLVAVMPFVPARAGVSRLGRLPGAPLAFRGNGAGFVASGADYRLSVSAGETVLRYEAGFGDVDHWVREEEFRMRLLGAARSARETLTAPRPEAATFAHVYPHIHLECSGTVERLEYRFIAAPGADAARIRLRVEGAGRMRIDADGSVRAATPVGEVRIYRPAVEDAFDGEWRVLEGAYVLGRGGLVEYRPRHR